MAISPIRVESSPVAQVRKGLEKTNSPERDANMTARVRSKVNWPPGKNTPLDKNGSIASPMQITNPIVSPKPRAIGLVATGNLQYTEYANNSILPWIVRQETRNCHNHAVFGWAIW